MISLKNLVFSTRLTVGVQKLNGSLDFDLSKSLMRQSSSGPGLKNGLYDGKNREAVMGVRGVEFWCWEI